MLDTDSPPAYALVRDHVLAPVRNPEHGFRLRFWNQVLRWTGWKIVGTYPTVDKYIMIIAPHTSNWDVPLGLIVGWAGKILLEGWPYGFMIKDVWFKGPLGPIMRGLGGLPIDRSRPHEVVGQMAEALEQHDRFLLAITPEGTRKRTKFWKSGFYFIAQKAEVPIVPISLDYGRKEVGVGDAITVTGDMERDMALFRAFFADVTPRYPDNFGPIRFRERDTRNRPSG
jgi:1-acyl-sn-glycerol-3-phosphate acyltransferase